MSKMVELLVHVPDNVYDSAKQIAKHTKTTVEAVMSVATEQAMNSVAINVDDLKKLHRLVDE